MEVLGVASPDLSVTELPIISLSNVGVFSVRSAFQKLAARPAGGERVGVSLQLITVAVVPVIFEDLADFELTNPFHLNRDQRLLLDVSSQKSKFDPSDSD